MNLIAKILVPASIALSAFAAQAASPQGAFADYPGTAASHVSAAAGAAAAALSVGAPAFRGEESPMHLQHKATTQRTREEVQREAAQPARQDPAYAA